MDLHVQGDWDTTELVQDVFLEIGNLAGDDRLFPAALVSVEPRLPELIATEPVPCQQVPTRSGHLSPAIKHELAVRLVPFD
jgi:hypothetical protein